MDCFPYHVRVVLILRPLYRTWGTCFHRGQLSLTHSQHNARQPPLGLSSWAILQCNFLASQAATTTLTAFARAALARTDNITERHAALPPCPRALAVSPQLPAAPKYSMTRLHPALRSSLLALLKPIHLALPTVQAQAQPSYQALLSGPRPHSSLPSCLSSMTSKDRGGHLRCGHSRHTARTFSFRVPGIRISSSCLSPPYRASQFHYCQGS